MTPPPARVLDGHHRLRAATELGIEAPTIRRTFRSDAERMAHVVALNLKRRHLDPDPLRPIMRGIVETTPKQLTILYKFLELSDALREPDDDLLDLVRTFLAKRTRTL